MTQTIHWNWGGVTEQEVREKVSINGTVYGIVDHDFPGSAAIVKQHGNEWSFEGGGMEPTEASNLLSRAKKMGKDPFKILYS